MSWIESQFHRFVDRIYAATDQPQPSRESLAACRIISHRGEHNDPRVIENTLEAFERAHRAGVWGIELDLRWTRDLVPVVFHDENLARIYGRDVTLSDLTWPQVSAEYPLIPRLQTVVERFGGRMHLMLEIKAEPYPDPAYQRQLAAKLFSDLKPQHDFHFLTLTPAMLDHFDFVSPQCFLPVAQTNFHRISRLALDKSYGGFLGHYALISNGRIKRHKKRGQAVGTGYIRSLNCLYRELNRGVSWLFSNHAAHLKAELNGVLQQLGGYDGVSGAAVNPALR